MTSGRLLLALVFAALLGAVSAATYTHIWVGGASGAFWTASNWSPASVPNGGSFVAYIPCSPTTPTVVSYDSNVGTLSGLWLGSEGCASVTLHVNYPFTVYDQIFVYSNSTLSINAYTTSVGGGFSNGTLIANSGGTLVIAPPANIPFQFLPGSPGVRGAGSLHLGDGAITGSDYTTRAAILFDAGPTCIITTYNVFHRGGMWLNSTNAAGTVYANSPYWYWGHGRFGTPMRVMKGSSMYMWSETTPPGPYPYGGADHLLLGPAIGSITNDGTVVMNINPSSIIFGGGAKLINLEGATILITGVQHSYWYDDGTGHPSAGVVNYGNISVTTYDLRMMSNVWNYAIVSVDNAHLYIAPAFGLAAFRMAGPDARVSGTAFLHIGDGTTMNGTTWLPYGPVLFDAGWWDIATVYHHGGATIRSSDGRTAAELRSPSFNWGHGTFTGPVHNAVGARINVVNGIDSTPPFYTGLMHDHFMYYSNLTNDGVINMDNYPVLITFGYGGKLINSPIGVFSVSGVVHAYMADLGDSTGAFINYGTVTVISYDLTISCNFYNYATLTVRYPGADFLMIAPTYGVSAFRMIGPNARVTGTGVLRIGDGGTPNAGSTFWLQYGPVLFERGAYFDVATVKHHGGGMINSTGPAGSWGAELRSPNFQWGHGYFGNTVRNSGYISVINYVDGNPAGAVSGADMQTHFMYYGTLVNEAGGVINFDSYPVAITFGFNGRIINQQFAIFSVAGVVHSYLFDNGDATGAFINYGNVTVQSYDLQISSNFLNYGQINVLPTSDWLLIATPFNKCSFRMIGEHSRITGGGLLRLGDGSSTNQAANDWLRWNPILFEGGYWDVANVKHHGGSMINSSSPFGPELRSPNFMLAHGTFGNRVRNGPTGVISVINYNDANPGGALNQYQMQTHYMYYGTLENEGRVNFDTYPVYMTFGYGGKLLNTATGWVTVAGTVHAYLMDAGDSTGAFVNYGRVTVVSYDLHVYSNVLNYGLFEANAGQYLMITPTLGLCNFRMIGSAARISGAGDLHIGDGQTYNGTTWAMWNPILMDGGWIDTATVYFHGGGQINATAGFGPAILKSPNFRWGHGFFLTPTINRGVMTVGGGIDGGPPGFTGSMDDHYMFFTTLTNEGYIYLVTLPSMITFGFGGRLVNAPNGNIENSGPVHSYFYDDGSSTGWFENYGNVTVPVYEINFHCNVRNYGTMTINAGLYLVIAPSYGVATFRMIGPNARITGGGTLHFGNGASFVGAEYQRWGPFLADGGAIDVNTAILHGGAWINSTSGTTQFEMRSPNFLLGQGEFGTPVHIAPGAVLRVQPSVEGFPPGYPTPNQHRVTAATIYNDGTIHCYSNPSTLVLGGSGTIINQPGGVFSTDPNSVAIWMDDGTGGVIINYGTILPQAGNALLVLTDIVNYGLIAPSTGYAVYWYMPPTRSLRMVGAAARLGGGGTHWFSDGSTDSQSGSYTVFGPLIYDGGLITAANVYFRGGASIISSAPNPVFAIATNGFSWQHGVFQPGSTVLLQAGYTMSIGTIPAPLPGSIANNARYVNGFTFAVAGTLQLNPSNVGTFYLELSNGGTVEVRNGGVLQFVQYQNFIVDDGVTAIGTLLIQPGGTVLNSASSFQYIHTSVTTRGLISVNSGGYLLLAPTVRNCVVFENGASFAGGGNLYFGSSQAIDANTWKQDGCYRTAPGAFTSSTIASMILMGGATLSLAPGSDFGITSGTFYWWGTISGGAASGGGGPGMTGANAGGRIHTSADAILKLQNRPLSPGLPFTNPPSAVPATIYLTNGAVFIQGGRVSQDAPLNPGLALANGSHFVNVAGGYMNISNALTIFDDPSSQGNDTFENYGYVGITGTATVTISTTVITDYAFVVAGTATYTPPVSNITLVPVVYPPAPVSVSALPTGVTGQVAVSFQNPPLPPGGFAPIQYVITAQPGGIQQTVYTASSTAIFTGLTDEVPYTFTIQSQSFMGVSAPSLPSLTAVPFRADRCNSTEAIQCLNGALCVATTPDFTCQCSYGYAGRYCQTDINDCAPNPCTLPQICADRPGSYLCYVPNNACSVQNGGCDSLTTCSLSSGVVSCSACPAGYAGTGKTGCQPICLAYGCLNGGTCSPGVGNAPYTCQCPSTHSGTRCETAVNYCTSAALCSNGGVCVNGIGTYRCSCAAGWTGTSCTVPYNACTANVATTGPVVCYHGGASACSPIPNSNQFYCPPCQPPLVGDGVNCLAVNAPPSISTVPTATSGGDAGVRLSPNGVSIIVPFTIATDVGTSKVGLPASAASCAPLLNTTAVTRLLFGAGFTCSWTDSHTFVIWLGKAATVTQTDSFSLTGGVLKQSAAPPQTAQTFPTTVVVPNLPVVTPTVTPTVTLLAPTQLSVCGATSSIRLDASQTTGSGGRPLSFSWSCTDVNGATALGQIPNLSSQAVVTLSGTAGGGRGSALLVPGVSYVFSVTVTNYQGVSSAPSSVTVTKLPVPLPHLTLSPPLRPLRSAALTVSVDLQLPELDASCQAYLSSLGLTAAKELAAYNWLWSFQPNPSVDPAFPLTATNWNTILTRRTLSVPAGVLPANTPYKVTLTATPKFGTSNNAVVFNSLFYPVSASIGITLAATPPVAVIAGSTTRKWYIVGTSPAPVTMIPLVLSGATSYDPDHASTVTKTAGVTAFVWSCVDTSVPLTPSTPTNCGFSPSAVTWSGATLTIPSSQAAVFTVGHSYVFTLTVGTPTFGLARPGTTGVVSTTVNVLSDPSNPPHVSINSTLPLNPFVGTQQLRLVTQIDDKSLYSGASYSYVWTETSINALNLTLVKSSGRTSANLALPARTLADGGVYTFVVTVTRKIGAVLTTGSSSITVTVNAPPRLGTCLATPNAGAVSLKDPVTIACDGWTSDAAPIWYSFAYFNASAATTSGAAPKEIRLKSKSSSATAAVYLPVGTWSIVVYIVDGFGASTRTIVGDGDSPVVVTADPILAATAMPPECYVSTVAAAPLAQSILLSDFASSLQLINGLTGTLNAQVPVNGTTSTVSSTVTRAGVCANLVPANPLLPAAAAAANGGGSTNSVPTTSPVNVNTTHACSAGGGDSQAATNSTVLAQVRVSVRSSLLQLLNATVNEQSASSASASGDDVALTRPYESVAQVASVLHEMTAVAPWELTDHDVSSTLEPLLASTVAQLTGSVASADSDDRSALSSSSNPALNNDITTRAGADILSIVGSLLNGGNGEGRSCSESTVTTRITINGNTGNATIIRCDRFTNLVSTYAAAVVSASLAPTVADESGMVFETPYFVAAGARAPQPKAIADDSPAPLFLSSASVIASDTSGGRSGGAAASSAPVVPSVSVPEQVTTTAVADYTSTPPSGDAPRIESPAADVHLTSYDTSIAACYEENIPFVIANGLGSDANPRIIVGPIVSVNLYVAATVRARVADSPVPIVITIPESGDAAAAAALEPLQTVINGLVSLATPDSAPRLCAEPEPECVYWDAPNAVWSNVGCTTSKAEGASNGTYTCSCNHLTEFALLRERFGPCPNVVAERAYQVFTFIYPPLFVVVAIQIARLVKSGGHVLNNAVIHHYIVGLTALARFFECVFFGFGSTKLSALGAAVLATLPYMLMYWSFTCLVFQWGSTYHLAMKVRDTFKYVFPVFVALNVVFAGLTAALIFALTLDRSGSNLSSVSTAGSVILAGLSLATAVGFVVYGTALYRQLTANSSKPRTSGSGSSSNLTSSGSRSSLNSTAPSAGDVLGRKIYIVTCMFASALTVEAICQIISGAGSDLFSGDAAEIITAIYLAADVCGLCALLYLFYAGFTAIIDAADERAREKAEREKPKPRPSAGNIELANSKSPKNSGRNTGTGTGGSDKAKPRDSAPEVSVTVGDSRIDSELGGSNQPSNVSPAPGTAIDSQTPAVGTDVSASSSAGYAQVSVNSDGGGGGVLPRTALTGASYPEFSTSAAPAAAPDSSLVPIPVPAVDSAAEARL